MAGQRLHKQGICHPDTDGLTQGSVSVVLEEAVSYLQEMYDSQTTAR